jgi:hypothetical protein
MDHPTDMCQYRFELKERQCLDLHRNRSTWLRRPPGKILGQWEEYAGRRNL